MRRLLIVGAAAALVLVPFAPGAAGEPAVSSLYLGIAGDPARFKAQTGQASTIQHVFIGWDQGRTYAKRLPILLRLLAPIPMIHIGAGGPLGKKQVITPLQISRGQGDAFLVALNEAISEYNGLVYLRLLSEMNHFKHFHSAFNANGSSRGPAYNPPVYRKAFARMHLILHGGRATPINTALGKLGLPGFAGTDLPRNRASKLRVIWNPLGGGQPAITPNAAYQFYPGDRYVDIVGNDIYGVSGQFAQPQNEYLYAFARQHRKPFALPEWGVKDTDYPAFILYVCNFIRSKPGIELAAYYKAVPGGVFDLADKPQSRRAYRRCITPLGRPAK